MSQYVWPIADFVSGIYVLILTGKIPEITG